MTDPGPPPEATTPTARCLWCGSERPVDIATCPTCEHAWIDATIDEARAGGFAAPSPDPAEDPPDRRSLVRRHALLVGLTTAVVAVYSSILLLDAGSPAALPAATTSPPASTVSVAEATTQPPTTTSQPPTTTTTTTTTTTLPPIEVVEPPFDVDSLTLGAFAMGPIGFGDDDPDLVGRLAATFGQPDAVLPANERWGLCEGETGRVLVFGYLSAIFRDGDNGEEFVGYRQRWKDNLVEAEHPTGSLQTISGLALLERLSRANQLYLQVATSELTDQMDETMPPGTPIYLVQRSSDSRTLIWGKLSGDEDPVILSINSPNACDAGPAG